MTNSARSRRKRLVPGVDICNTGALRHLFLKHNSRVLWAAVAAFLLLAVSCQSRKKGTFTVTGRFKNANELSAQAGPISKVYLLEVTYGKDQPPITIDSAKLPVSNGSFTLSGATRDQEIYEVVFGNNAIAVPLINDASDVHIDVDLAKKDDFYQVRGSDASNQLKDLIDVFGKKNFQVEKGMAAIDSLKQANAPDSVLQIAAARQNDAISDVNMYLNKFINTGNNATLCALALSWSSRTLPPQEFLMSIIRVSSGSRGSMRSSPSSTANGSCATCCSAHNTAWPSPLGSPWRT